MTVEGIYKLCFYGGLCLLVIFLITAVVLFFTLKIPKVIGDLTGSNAKKGISRLRSGVKCSTNVEKREQQKYYTRSEGKITVHQSVSDSVSVVEDVRKQANDEPTKVLAGAKKEIQDNTGEETTTLLTAQKNEEELTMVLTGDMSSHDSEQSENITAVLKVEDEATEVLSVEEQATEVLTEESDDASTTVLARNNIEVIYDIVVVHTDEFI